MPRRCAVAREDFRLALRLGLRTERLLTGARGTATEAAAVAVVSLPLSPGLPRRFCRFHARRARAASLRARLASRRASLNRLRARFNWSLASRICWRATSARNFAVASDSSPGASSPGSLTCRQALLPAWRAQKVSHNLCDDVTADRFRRGAAEGALSTEPVHNSVHKWPDGRQRIAKIRRIARPTSE